MVRVSYLLVLVLGIASAQGPTDEEHIRKVLTDQVEAWNRGDLEGYMKGYWNSDSTMFVSGGTVTRGYHEVLEGYHKAYGTKEKMGKLELTDVVVRSLSSMSAIVSGVWKLRRAKDQPWGRFTLLVERKEEGWRITHDHTSSSQ